MTAAQSPKARTAYPAAVSLLILAGTFLLYRKVGSFPFILLDDRRYIVDNPQVLAGLTPGGLSWALSTYHAANWHPLTWLSHMADVALFGPAAGPHHLVSAGLHAANAALLFLALREMTGALWRSAFVACLFAVHPLHVESVAWVSERKDLLCGLFFTLATWSYVRYAARGGRARYALATALFALALAAKPMAVTWPFALLLLDYWPLRRMRPAARAAADAGALPPVPAGRLVAEKAPWLLMSLASCVVTYLAQSQGGAVSSPDLHPLTERAANAALSWVRYLGNAVWPGSLAVYYPHPFDATAGGPYLEAAGAAAALVATTALAIRWRTARPWFLAGWLWYLGTLVPVIGLVQAGGQAMADRYTYIPMTGIFIVIAWGIPEAAARIRLRPPALAVAASAAVLALAVATSRQIAYWRSDAALFGHALEATADNWMAHLNLGNALAMEGKGEEAAAHFREVVRLRPLHADAHHNLGLLLFGQKRPAEARPHFEAVLRLRPGDPMAAALLRMTAEAASRAAPAGEPAGATDRNDERTGRGTR